MKHGLRAGGIAALVLALAASSASAAPSTASGADAANAASLPASGSVPVARNAVIDAGVRRSGIKIRSTLVAARVTKIAGLMDTRPAEALVPALHKLVRAYEGEDAGDAEQKCLAGAVYFEARGEPLEGQLAVAQVILNRTASGEYPASICDVVTQPAQFSFVRNGLVPPIDENSLAWRRALAVAHIASAKLANELGSNVLWYHADYVAPRWDRRLAAVVQIGAHIFYRRA